MKMTFIILFLFLVVGLRVNASQIPEDLSIISVENIEDLQPVITYQRENTATIYDFVWLENEETTAIIFAGISGFFYLDLTADELSARQLGTYNVYSISINPVSQIIALADGRMVHLINPETGEDVAVLTHDFAISAEFSQDGNLLATGDGAGGIKIWDTTDYELIHNLQAEFDHSCSKLKTVN